MDEVTDYLRPPTRRKGGRPSKFTPATKALILRLVARGVPFVHVAAAAGISSQALANYRAACPRFADAVRRAVARGVAKRLRKIEAASESGDWRAAAWLLEHCQPEHFAKNRLEVTGADGAPLIAGVQLYLPRKNEAEQGPVIETPPAAVIAERSSNGNGN